MDIPNPTVIIAPDVSNALAVISTSKVQEKKNQKMSNVFSVMVTTQPTTKDALSTKTYRREPSHRYAANKKKEKKNRNFYRRNKPNRTSLMLLPSNLSTINPRLLARKPNNNQHSSSSCNCHQVTNKN